MLALLRSLLRRPVRTLLTVAGVSIGILALTLLGAMAERLGQLVAGSSAMWTQSIMLLPGREGPLAELILPDQVERVRSIPGVAGVQSRVEFPYAGAAGSLPGLAPMVSGAEPELLASLPLQSGRSIPDRERGVALAGAALAAREEWRVGDWIEVQGRTFRLVGVVAPGLTVADEWLYLPLSDARELLLESSPLLQAFIRQLGTSHGETPEGIALDLGRVATRLQVMWAEGVDAEQLARRIQGEVPELTALSPRTMEELLSERLRLLHAVVWGSTLIGLAVAAVSVVNTMLVSVHERRSEIALKRALGATTAWILREVVGESILLCALGGLFGAAVGSLLSFILNMTGIVGYERLFLVTPRLVATGLVLSMLLGAMAGIGPALHATRLSPAEGLRRE